ncbi:hypothetical protein LG045_01575 [Limosilactobacillus gastricus]|uniref:Uncharacterized protein n=1 Tax=Limosilactobacillus gastricus DSM 16045 TaxID=1423749 RepID=A0A0R1VHZ9_9LACO|nr:hypothetical protein [Limosilactobacillus gastricus]KRM03739.1 hypothetical protein FC60_GL000109 [Limosilactobacillus gastricus DSM 16045]QGF39919.1 hypothetical protein LG045_01575 [Limosilactobacillus gastricus]
MKRSLPTLIPILSNLAMFVAGMLLVMRLFIPMIICLLLYVVAASYQFAWITRMQMRQEEQSENK